MSFIKVKNTLDDLIQPLTIVCCGGTQCNSNKDSNKYENSKSRSLKLYGPTHNSSNSCTQQ